ncbi:GAP family protein [Nonomuraea sp. NPDC004580]|uniref:GAP family protein n=1 Tax=Nonomuraea sp. NPDC004580 TaxID=3154552 RepID=UPI0033BA7493
MSIEIIATVLGVALLDTLSPSVIGVTLYVLLASPRRTAALLGTYLGAVAVAYFALGALLMLGLGAIVPVIDGTALAWGKVVLGGALIVASYRIPQQGAAPEARSFTVGAMLALGLGTWLFEFATAVPYFAAIGIMTSAGLAAAQWLALLGAYVLIMVLPGLLLWPAWLALGERTRGRFETWRAKLASGSRATLSWIVWIAGFLIVADAAATLFPETVTVPWR